MSQSWNKFNNPNLYNVLLALIFHEKLGKPMNIATNYFVDYFHYNLSQIHLGRMWSMSLSESKVLQNLVMCDNLADLYTFVEVLNMMNNTELWDAELSWYSQILTCQILAIWPYMIIKIFVNWAKFLQSSGHSSVINCAFIFH